VCRRPASLELLNDGSWAEDVRRIERGLAAGLAPARLLPGVRDVRVLGAIGVVELGGPVDVERATRAAVERGAWLRPFRNRIYTMPPYVCSDPEIGATADAVVAATQAGGQ
jgi:adenosylmethionine---8-amino-7-oxononanoate aminotransferase